VRRKKRAEIAANAPETASEAYGSPRFFARRFSFFDCALDFPVAATAVGTGAVLRALLLPAGFQPSSSGPELWGVTDCISAAFPGRSKPHISHSKTKLLFEKVQRGHDHSSSAITGAGCEAFVEASGFRATLAVCPMDEVGRLDGGAL